MVNKRNILFDLIRGVSAVIVMVSHLRNTMFLDYSELGNQTGIFTKVFYFLTGLGHQAVMIFFVLSGFFVGGSVINKNRIFKFYDYLLARLTRLWVVVVPALFFTFFLDLIVKYLSPEIMEGSYLNVMNSGPSDSYSLGIDTFISNLFFFQTIFTPVFGSNGPLWSLANEFWYYILFPLMIIGFRKKSYSTVIKIISILLFFTISFMIYDKLEGYVIWLLGALVYAFYESKSDNKLIKRVAIVCATLIFITSIVISKKDFFANTALMSNDLFIGIAFSILIYSVKDSKFFKIENSYLTQFSIWLSNISFSLYVTHFPILMLIFSLFYKDNTQSLSLSSYSEFVLISFLLIGFGYLFWFLFEKRTDSVKKIIKNKFKFINKNIITTNK